MEECVLVFETTHDAILAEQILLEEGIKALVMPLPGEIRAGCGICLRISPEAYPVAKGLLHRSLAAAPGVYSRRVTGGKSEYMPYVEGENHGAE